ncbi:hypothetical protein PVAP13_7NG171934 [Panicum virgatum]|uniref:Uncharacterized protein n=1 Tax=Panicum virgatum TaxID=38727 RepID=A0A8T0PWZ2_PANVG|nr:hypothetical protein PVAP13_7NG171934 [Panicum virgatum]
MEAPRTLSDGTESVCNSELPLGPPTLNPVPASRRSGSRGSMWPPRPTLQHRYPRDERHRDPLSAPAIPLPAVAAAAACSCARARPPGRHQRPRNGIATTVAPETRMAQPLRFGEGLGKKRRSARFEPGRRRWAASWRSCEASWAPGGVEIR